MRIYSQIDGTLLHEVTRKGEIGYDRHDIGTPLDPLQVGCWKMEADKEYAAHFHLPNVREIQTTQEAFVVVEGMLSMDFYDHDNTYIQTEILHAGDCAVTFVGGHRLCSKADGTIVYEIKNGPYLGRDKDKECFDGH